MSAKQLTAKIISQAYFKLFGPQQAGRRVLMYHSIGENDAASSAFSVSRKSFIAQMALLRDLNIPVVKLDAPYDSSFSVSLTFDDGYSDNVDLAAPILEDFGFPATVYACSAFLDKPGFLTTSVLRNLPEALSVGSHAHSHRPLAKLTALEQREELYRSKAILEDNLGRSVNQLSFPHGSYSPETIRLSQECQYKNAGTSQFKINRVPGFLVHRSCIMAHDTIARFEAKLLGAEDWRSFGRTEATL